MEERRHQIDDLFRSRLKDHSQSDERLGNVWQRIEKKRNFSYIALNHLQVRWKLYSLTVLLMGVFTALPFVYESDAVVFNKTKERALKQATEKIILSDHPQKKTAEVSAEKQVAHSLSENTTEQKENPEAGNIENVDLPQKKKIANIDLQLMRADFLLTDKVSSLQGDLTQVTPEVIKGKLFAIDVLYSPDFYLAKKLAAIKHPEGDEYAQLRKSTETIESAFSAAVRLNYQWTDNISFQSGIHYYQVKERLDATIERIVERTFFDSTIAMFVGAGGGDHEQPNYEGDGMITIRRTYTDSVHAQNSYEFIDIPFMVGYHIGHGKLRLNVYSGITYNLVFKKKGKVLDEKGKLMSIDENSFQQKSGISIYTSAGLSYAISPKIAILFEPSLRYGLNSLTSKESPVYQRYSTFGINSGLRFKL